MNESRDTKKYLSTNPLKRKLINWFFEDLYLHIEKLDSRTILDIGCGEGFVDEFLFSKNPRYQITGVDLSKKAIKNAKKRVPKLSVQQGDAYNLPFKKNIFDLTICLEVLEHLDQPAKAIAEARRVSKKYCLFSVPNEPIFSLLCFFGGARIKHLGRHPDHIHYWNKRSFRNLVQKHFAKPVVIKMSSVWILATGEK